MVEIKLAHFHCIAEFCIECRSVTDNGPLGNTTREQICGNNVTLGFRVIASIILANVGIHLDYLHMFSEFALC